MKNTFDKYVNRKSFWHQLNPLVKLVTTIFLIVVIFLPLGFFGQLFLFVALSIIWLVAKLGWKLFKSILIAWAIMLVLLFVINWLVYKSPALVIDIDRYSFIGYFNRNIFNLKEIDVGQHHYTYIFGDLWGGVIDPYGLKLNKPLPTDLFNKYITRSIDGITYYLAYQSSWYTLSSLVVFNTFNVSFKIMLMIMVVTILVSTTSEIQLTGAIEDLLSPLKLFKIPVNEWAMIISIAIRFVPSLLTESQNILKAQASRGVDFKNGNFKDRIKSLVSLIVPMFSVAFHKADDLSNAMEARNYSPRAIRTSYRNYSVSYRDFLALGLTGLVFGFLIIYVNYKMIMGPFGWIEVITTNY
ncbi:MAG: energy-coupling factor transporter transmembrane protein EcfT [Mycoplasma sp.]